jgi:carbonic anhydrase
VVSGQSPFAVVLTCSDSRVVPELIFDTGIGELFIIRVAGNIANTSSIASIEYAVANLNVSVVMVLGHQNCGAVTSALSDGNIGKNLDHLLQHIKPAISEANSKVVDAVSTLHVKLTAEKLISDSKIISDAVESGAIKIVPSFYSLDTGKVYFAI